MSISVRRKRNSRDLRCILFPDEVKDKLKNTSGVASTKNPISSLKSWQRCGDGFLDTPVQKKAKSVYQKPTTARLTTEKFKLETEEPVNIAWSSSEGESDCEESSLPPKPVTTPTLSESRPKPKLNVSSYLQLLNSEADELPAIDSDSDLSDDDGDEDEVRGDVEVEPDNTGAISDCFTPEKDKHEEKQPKEIQTVPDVDISDYPSDGEDGPAVETALLTNAGPNPVDPSEGGRRSLKDWVRSAQALLQTPQKHGSCHFKTPDDSNKKRRKFESGGLADRLNRLQSRQRSAVSFWRYQSTADITTTAGKSGVLALQLLHLQEDCGLSIALCQRQRMKEAPHEGHQNPSPGHQDVAEGQEDAGESDRCLVLFSRETVAHLAPSPGDLIHVHPPWQTLVIEGESRLVILNAHFSQKVLASETQSHVAPSPKHLPHAHRCGSYPLNRSWGQHFEQSRTQAPATITNGDGGGSSRQAGVCERVWPEPRGVCDSLLEALESLGPAGALSQQLEVVLQRVYCLPIPQSSALRLHGLRRSPHAPSAGTSSNSGGGNTIGRLCVLVQDACGMFSEVQLQALTSEDQLHLLIKQWEGRTCLLQGFKVLQRVTRDRCAPLFSLIDSLWPPTLPLRVHGDPVSCEESKTTAAAPSFCYRLSGSEGSVVVSQEMPLSLLYRPPVMHSLQEILKVGKEGGRYSFTADVVFIRLQASGSCAGDGESWLLFVTDTSLQCVDEPRPDHHHRRTLTVFFSPPCVLQHSVRQAISAASSSTSCPITFRDALLQRGTVVCSEQTTVCPAWAPGDALHPLPKPLGLDQLGPETAPNTLCTLTGVIVGVDEETAYSWPVCILCESERLERALALQEGFLCTACGAEVLKPIIKMQLEVFLSCPSLSDCTIKMKLQQKSIDSLLSSLDGDPEYYDVESILGKEVGPVSAYVRVITRTPGLWVGLEEVCI